MLTYTKYINVDKTVQCFLKLFDNGKLFFRTAIILELRKILFGKHCLKNLILYHITDLNN